MIESMACGTPVVALRGGAVPDVIVDGVTGIICDDPAELPDAIAAAAALEPAACRRHVAANFSVSQFGSGYERIYRRMVDPRPTPDMGFALRPAVGQQRRSDERASA
jgi:glycosyltransferase involved in cell wall biosynthesis